MMRLGTAPGIRARNWLALAMVILGLPALTACGANDGTSADAEAVSDTLVEADASASGPIGLKVPALTWSACGEAFPGTECSVALVPLDYDRPFGDKTAIALARIPASDPKHRVGSVFINPGGPGGSGVSFALSDFGPYLASLLQGRFDIVGFDPRGVGASAPLRCFDTQDELNAFFGAVPVFPYKAEQTRPFFDQLRSLAGQCLGRHAAITAHMSTADVARDLDLLRRAVGDARLTYLGFSYGTQLGSTYANLFPKNVRALVIDGVLNPQDWVAGTTVVTDRLKTGRVVAEFMRLCDAAGDACALSGGDGAAARYEALANAVLQTPIDLGDGLYTYDFLISDTTLAMYTPELWGGPDGWGALFAALADLALGDAAVARRAFTLRTSLYEQLRRSRATQEQYDNSVDAYYGVRCADAEYPKPFSVWKTIGNFAATGSRFGAGWWWQDASCADWPRAADRYAGPWNARTSAPVLIVGNYFDPATPYDGAQASSRLLPNSRLLSYAGWGHCAFSRNQCATDYIVSYLLDGRLPPKGTVCAENPNPFEPRTALRALSAQPSAPLVGLPPLVPGVR
jgi:pimeloyl-ACP methyl ester carboxylesterase